MRAYSGRVQLHHNICSDGDHLCTWEPLTLARQLGCCPRIFVQGLVLFPPWSLAHCSQHGDQLSDGAQLVSGYEYSHVTHIQVVISVLLAPDLSWCEVA